MEVNDTDITQESPLDIVKTWEATDGTTLVLMRGHRDQIDGYKSSRRVPESFVLNLLQNNLLGAIGSIVLVREFEGILGLVRYMVSELPEGSYGSPEAVENWLRRRDG